MMAALSPYADMVSKEGSLNSFICFLKFKRPAAALISVSSVSTVVIHLMNLVSCSESFRYIFLIFSLSTGFFTAFIISTGEYLSSIFALFFMIL